MTRGPKLKATRAHAGPAAELQEEPPRSFLRRHVWTIGYVCVVLAWSAYFSNVHVAGSFTRRIEVFSDLFIPCLALFVHLLLLRLLPLAAYCAVVGADLVVSVGLATYHGYFHDNVDMHTVVSNLSEGAEVPSSVLMLLPVDCLILGGLATVLMCALGAKVKSQLRFAAIAPLGVLVLAMFGFGAVRQPLGSASEEIHYAKCIKLHGYYTAMLSDWIAAGGMPSEDALLRQMDRVNRQHPLVRIDAEMVRPHPYDSLVAVQVESLDYQVIGRSFQDSEVTPFLNRTRQKAIFLKLDPFHFGGSGSSGPDLQFLAGKLPPRTYPVYRITRMDYSQSLPASYAQGNVESFAFHGNHSSFFGRGLAYARMSFTRFFDLDALPDPDTRWGLSDEALFAFARQVINRREGRLHFFFLITLTSHIPFDFVEHKCFDGPDLVTAYFNAIHYTDQALEAFFSSLEGRFLVILYGDHCANVANAEYDSRENGREFVAGFIFLVQDGEVRRPPVERNNENWATGELDIRSLHDFAKRSFP
jgi:hypothetical protein